MPHFDCSFIAMGHRKLLARALACSVVVQLCFLAAAIWVAASTRENLSDIAVIRAPNCYWFQDITFWCHRGIINKRREGLGASDFGNSAGPVYWNKLGQEDDAQQEIAGFDTTSVPPAWLREAKVNAGAVRWIEIYRLPLFESCYWTMTIDDMAATRFQNTGWTIRHSQYTDPLRGRVVIPTTYLLTGVLGNTAALSALWVAAELVHFYVVRRIRLRRGRCTHCNYDLRYLAVERCPECGEVRV